ncbi:MAG: phosphotransferase [Dehalococcoidia bacterium]
MGTNLKIPAGPHELSEEWLTAALRQTGTIRKARVTAFDMDPNIAAGVGFMGILAKLAVEYDQPEEGAPASIIAKFPTPIPENRQIAELYHFYESETRFYEQIADEVELRTPRRYYSQYDTESGDFILLLEDMAPATVGDQVNGCSIAQAELCLRELAKFHATWWESPRLKQLDWLPDMNETVRKETVQANYQAAWPHFVAGFGKLVPPAILELGEQFGSKVTLIMDQLAEPPFTIMHGDYRLDNLFFATPEGGEPIAVVDWQIMNRGRGAFDVAYFMTGTLSPADRKANERELLTMYHNTLLERGVSDYDFDEFWLDYRKSTLFCWLYAVIVLGTLDVANERGLALFTQNLERNVAALTELNAAELLPA